MNGQHAFWPWLTFLAMQVISRLMSETSSGSFCSNDSVLQSLMVALPFGGVGKSVASHIELLDNVALQSIHSNKKKNVDRCQWNGILPWPLQLWYLLPQEIMPAPKHPVWVCHLSALSALWGPQSVSNDLGQHLVPEEPGLVPDPVTVCGRAVTQPWWKTSKCPLGYWLKWMRKICIVV